MPCELQSKIQKEFKNWIHTNVWHLQYKHKFKNKNNILKKIKNEIVCKIVE